MNGCHALFVGFLLLVGWSIGDWELALGSDLNIVELGLSKEDDQEQQIEKFEKVLSPISLGRILPGRLGVWLIVVEPKFEQEMKCYEVGKTCACTSVRLVSESVLPKLSSISVLLDLKSDRIGSNRSGDFYLFFMGVVNGKKQVVRLIQPFSFTLSEEVEFGCIVIRSEFFDDDSPVRRAAGSKLPAIKGLRSDEYIIIG